MDAYRGVRKVEKERDAMNEIVNDFARLNSRIVAELPDWKKQYDLRVSSYGPTGDEPNLPTEDARAEFTPGRFLSCILFRPSSDGDRQPRAVRDDDHQSRRIPPSRWAGPPVVPSVINIAAAPTAGTDATRPAIDLYHSPDREPRRQFTPELPP